MFRKPFAITLAATLLCASALAGNPDSRGETSAPFMLADVNGDGRVTADELDTLLNARFSVLDTDSDGRISTAALHHPTGNHRRGPPPGGAFRGPPPGGVPPGPPPGPPPEGFAGPGSPRDSDEGFPFPQPEDVDDDGFISRAEFLQPAAAMFDYWDRNHDGAVTAEEAHPATDR